jgi:HK97 gp10 family phage protein
MIIIPDPKGVEMLEKRISNVGDEVLDAVYESAVRSAPVKTRNSPGPAGELKRSIRRRSEKRIFGKRQVTVGTDHWHFVEYGTKPHNIYPRYKQALWWPDAGFPRAMVQHPGAKANPFMRRAVYQKRTIKVYPTGYVEVS